jgi:hypothetical protein
VKSEEGQGQEPWSVEEEMLLQDLKMAANRQDWRPWEDLHLQPDPRVAAQLMYDYLATLSQPLLLPDLALPQTQALQQTGTLQPDKCAVASPTALLSHISDTLQGNVKYSELAERLSVLNGSHYGVLFTLHKVSTTRVPSHIRGRSRAGLFEVLPTLNMQVVGLFRAVKGKASAGSLQRAQVRMGLALMQLDKVLGAVALNGRDLIHIPDPAATRTTGKTLRVAEPSALNKTLHQMELIDRFMTILVEGWHLVRALGHHASPSHVQSNRKPSNLPYPGAQNDGWTPHRREAQFVPEATGPRRRRRRQ